MHSKRRIHLYSHEVILGEFILLIVMPGCNIMPVNITGFYVHIRHKNNKAALPHHTGECCLAANALVISRHMSDSEYVPNMSRIYTE